MSDIAMLEQRLAKLGEELRGNTDLGDAIVRQIVAEGRVVRCPETTAALARRPLGWQALAAMAACLCVCFAVWWASRPTTLYARMLAALAKAETIHATGWSREVVRKWPLEKPLPADTAKTEKHAAEFWYWSGADGMPCSYEQVGPVVAIRRGGNLTEYQRDADLTYEFRGGFKKDRVAQFERMAGYLAALARPSLKKEELGIREENGRSLRGLRLTQGNSVEEYWFDIGTDLPAQMTRFVKESGEKTLELAFTIDERVPQAIADYRPPQTKLVRGGSGDERQRAWREHVAEVEREVLAKPIKGRVEIVPRKDGRTFSVQYAMRTPRGKCWVVPLDISENQKLTPAYFVRFYAASGDEERRAGTWRLPKNLHDQELLRCDLVYDDGVPWQEWVQFGLGQFGLEFEDVTEERTIWVAKHDGRPLRDWQQVKPPVPYLVEGGIEKKGVVRPGIGHLLVPVTMKELVDDFNQMIDSQDLAADKPWIVDETGLPAPPKYDKGVHGTFAEYRKNVIEPKFLVATDAPYFVGSESLEMAKEWYEKEFGITFHAERRPVTVHVVREKR
jgi:hypothetical protein